MTTDNRQMWTDLGIDLESHDALLNALGPVYQEIYLSQKKRPQGMGFFDFVVGDIHGIRVRELQEHARNGNQAVATRVAAMVRRVGLVERVVFAGGAAQNRCLRKLLGDKLGVTVTVPDEPQTVGALGAALLAEREGDDFS